jgi:holo-[acyl-carrier protein] synthase
MIRGIGIDIHDVKDFAAIVARSGDDYLKRVFTPDEIVYCDAAANAMETYAGKFAVKEAAMKALGTGWDGVDWRDFEVVNEASGKPVLQLAGRAATMAAELGISSSWVSLSHVPEYAVAQVIFEGQSREET